MASGHQLALGLRAAYMALHRHSDAIFSAEGATADQFVVLAALADSDSLTQQGLAERTASDPNTLRAMLVLLEQRGYVRRSPNPTDRRARCVALTDEGRRLYERLWQLGEPVRTQLVCGLGGPQAALLSDLLARLPAILAEASRAGSELFPEPGDTSSGRRSAVATPRPAAGT